MLDLKTHIKTYKAIITMLVLVFSLSPCSVKRNLLEIFDIQHITTLNKVKTTSQTSGCHRTTDASSNKISALKTTLKSDSNRFFFHLNLGFIASKEDQKLQNNYSGYTTGNSPPKYILFKRLKLNLV